MRPVELRCAGGRRLTLQVVTVALADRSGHVCAAVRPYVAPLRTFSVPAAWGGQLVVIWALATAARNDAPVSLEAEAAILPLRGSQQGCLALGASGTSLA